MFRVYALSGNLIVENSLVNWKFAKKRNRHKDVLNRDDLIHLLYVSCHLMLLSGISWFPDGIEREIRASLNLCNTYSHFNLMHSVQWIDSHDKNGYKLIQASSQETWSPEFVTRYESIQPVQVQRQADIFHVAKCSYYTFESRLSDCVDAHAGLCL